MGLSTGMYSTQGIVCTQVTQCKSHPPAVALIAGLSCCFTSRSSPSSLSLALLLSASLSYMSIRHRSFLYVSDTSAVFVHSRAFPHLRDVSSRAPDCLTRQTEEEKRRDVGPVARQ